MTNKPLTIAKPASMPGDARTKAHKKLRDPREHPLFKFHDLRVFHKTTGHLNLSATRAKQNEFLVRQAKRQEGKGTLVAYAPRPHVKMTSSLRRAAKRIDEAEANAKAREQILAGTEKAVVGISTI